MWSRKYPDQGSYESLIHAGWQSVRSDLPDAGKGGKPSLVVPWVRLMGGHAIKLIRRQLGQAPQPAA